jgi:hypothetical protein
MNMNLMVEELREERDRIDQALAVISRLALTNGQKRRGRPPNWMREDSQIAHSNGNSAHPRKGLGETRGGARKFTAATRKRMALAQKKRWKLIRQAQAKTAKAATA